ncbi:response regulator transcription factor [Saccharopolyspora indica]|uniref:DNA-binding response regulator, NarL/FixJ family, contains REC and HTH domains n=2 Tax=Saccharopolyspora TaxID=1835 RepID=A0A1I5FIB4_9PSEU|nr:MULTISPECIES: response regulator transcription factor [Saccharopolyspora]MDA3647154.1 response regulator transcription factor [Saccharopolyspora indica]RKT82152.1 LuxR family two component transcriptional regulator [Saccharopolyspora antimicrobica]SEG88510.1 two component transcriptional regulator, LuxR family [Saccharopolyspora kobensis]SFE00483.1 two component transcriptional regulator, LuxR family [Saccharopolyspora kobensis]SFO23061.1 DNA-binding response regulator, NarL/FixJ family, co
MTVRVLVVDDHPVVRAGISALLAGAEDIEVVGEASAAAEAVQRAGAFKPDVVLMDLQLGDDVGGVAATRQLLALPEPPHVLVLTTYDADTDINRAIDAGATGYLLKAGPPEELFQAIRAAAQGRTALSPEIASRLLQRSRTPEEALSDREVEILELLAHGLGNRDMARELFISEATVKTHLVHIYAKLGVDSRMAAVREAVRRRLIRFDDAPR